MWIIVNPLLKKGFYFHRIVFDSSKEVELALGRLEKWDIETMEDTGILSKFPYMCSELSVIKIKLFVCKASKEVIDFIIAHSGRIWDEYKVV